MSYDLITTEQSKMIVESMQSRFSKFKSFKVSNWQESKLLCFRIESAKLPGGFIELIGECVWDNKDRPELVDIYSKYIYFSELEEKYCITLLESAKWQFKEIPTNLQVEDKYKRLVADLKKQGRAKIIEATDISIKLKLLEK